MSGNLPTLLWKIIDARIMFNKLPYALWITHCLHFLKTGVWLWQWSKTKKELFLPRVERCQRDGLSNGIFFNINQCHIQTNDRSVSSINNLGKGRCLLFWFFVSLKYLHCVVVQLLVNIWNCRLHSAPSNNNAINYTCKQNLWKKTGVKQKYIKMHIIFQSNMCCL